MITFTATSISLGDEADVAPGGNAYVSQCYVLGWGKGAGENCSNKLTHWGKLLPTDFGEVKTLENLLK